MGAFGYFNVLNGRKMMFATEDEYYEMLRESEPETNSDSETDS